MLHPPGTRLGPYEIASSIGEGGMGEVYKARDTRLGRTVAVKVSKEAFGERFRNEALAVAALNHPHIAKLFDVGPDYLVMEYVEGKPLRGPLPVPEALALAGQIADALEHAHRNGIVHRDLKPSNILVTKNGVKVLDFGLAQRRLLMEAPGDGASTLTGKGAVAGTPPYMAPEQIEGKRADERTDVFAFGLLLHEMLTGERAFEGTSAAGVMAAILEKEPEPIASRKPETPPAVVKVVETCLAKDPGDRWQSVRELKHALDWASRADAPSPRGRRPAWMKVAAGVAAALIVAGAVRFVRRGAGARAPEPVRLQIPLPPTAQLATAAAVSPDGKLVAFALIFRDRQAKVFVRPLAALVARELPGTEQAFPSQPFWSPDSLRLGFWRRSEGLWTVDLRGGSPQLLVKEGRAGGNYGASWGSKDVILYSDAGKLLRVAAEGGEPEAAGTLVPGETGRFWPWFLPDGVHYIYLSLASRREDSGIYVGALGSDLRKRLVTAGHTAAYSPPGYLVYLREGHLVAQRFDAERLEVSGDPVPILDEEVERYSGAMLGGPASFSVSTTGVLAWSPAVPYVQQMTWFDRSGRMVGTIGEAGPFISASLSPDEKTVATCRVESVTSRDLWVVDTESGASRRLTFDPHDDCGAVWSPDGRRIAFFSDRRGVREIYEKPADGSGDDELVLAATDIGLNPEDWSPDGRLLSYNTPRTGARNDLFLLPRSKERSAVPVSFLATPATEFGSAFAPNGRYLAYTSNESGIHQVYVREVTPAGKPGPGKWQVSRSNLNSAWPRWRGDGKEIFFVARPPIRVMAVDVVTDGPTFRVGPERTLFDVPRGVEPPFRVSRDGQRFLFMVPANPPEPIRILVNWFPPGL